MINVLVLMGGQGSRFAVAGSAIPKPLLEVEPGRAMGRYVVDWLQPAEPHRFIFACLANHLDRFDFAPVFAGAREKLVVRVEGPTIGPAATALLASEHIATDDELIVTYCDGYLAPRVDDFIAYFRAAGAAGGVFTYPSNTDRESYAVVDAQGRVLRTAEKQVISPDATTGTYYFRSGREFVAAASSMVAAQAGLGIELFVCPVMNEIIAGGGVVKAYPITRNQRFDMGTPEDLASVRERLAAAKRETLHA